MSTDLFSQGYNDNQKSSSGIEKELTEKTKKKIFDRHKDNQRILKDMSDGYKEEPRKKFGYPRPTDPDKMSPLQLLSDGYAKLDEKRKAEKEERIAEEKRKEKEELKTELEKITQSIILNEEEND